MSVKIILPLLAIVGQIASQADQDALQVFKNQKHLDSLPNLPSNVEDKSALLSFLNQRPLLRPRPPYSSFPPPPPPPPQCNCPVGYSMCAQNPYDQAEVGCIVYCYRTFYPSLDLDNYRWVCPVNPDPFSSYPPQGPQPMGPFVPQPLGPFGPQPQGPFGPQPQGPFGPQPLGPFGPQPQGPFGPQPLGPFGPQPQGPFGPQPLGPFGPQSLDTFGPQQLEPFGPQPLGPLGQLVPVPVSPLVGAQQRAPELTQEAYPVA